MNFGLDTAIEFGKNVTQSAMLPEAAKSAVAEYWQIAAGTFAVVGLTAYAFRFRRRHLAEQAERQAAQAAVTQPRDDTSSPDSEELDDGTMIVHHDRPNTPPPVHGEPKTLRFGADGTLEHSASSSDEEDEAGLEHHTGSGSDNDAVYSSDSDNEEGSSVIRRNPTRSARK
tara:strand:+ start:62660 stop:63172 length:513 start_codon:yes stop_codon:yes gene_type:complete